MGEMFIEYHGREGCFGPVGVGVPALTGTGTVYRRALRDQRREITWGAAPIAFPLPPSPTFVPAVTRSQKKYK